MDENILTLNVDKCKYMILGVHGVADFIPQQLKLHGKGCISNCKCPVIERVTFIKYLGVMLDDKFKWTEHANYLRSKLRKLIYAFRNLSLVPPLEYAYDIMLM